MIHAIETNLPFNKESRLIAIMIQKRAGEDCIGCICNFFSRPERGTLVIEFEGNGATLRSFLFEADKAGILD